MKNKLYKIVFMLICIGSMLSITSLAEARCHHRIASTCSSCHHHGSYGCGYRSYVPRCYVPRCTYVKRCCYVKRYYVQRCCVPVCKPVCKRCCTWVPGYWCRGHWVPGYKSCGYSYGYGY